MSRGLSRTPSPAAPPPPRLAPLVFRLLGPVLLLALVAGIALARDWRHTRAEAAARATDVLRVVAERVGQYLEPASSNDTDTNATSPAFGPEVDAFVVGPSNELIRPAPVPWPPVVRPLDDQLPAVQRAAWQAARTAFESADWTLALTRFEALLGDRAVTNAADPALRPADSAAPGSRFRANLLYARALTLESLGRTNELIEAFQQALEAAQPGDTTEAGLAIPHLAALRILDLAGNRTERLPETWRRAPEWLCRQIANSASPLADRCLERLRPLLPTLFADPSGRSGGSPNHAEVLLEQPARARFLHAVAAASRNTTTPWPAAFWTENTSQSWLVVQQPGRALADTRTFVLRHSASLVFEIGDAASGPDPRGDFLVRLRICGRDLLGFRPSPDGRGHGVTPELLRGELASVSHATTAGVTCTLGISLENPTAYHAAQRQRLLVFGILLAAAVVLSAIATVATYRALLRQHELGIRKSNFVSSVSHELRAPLGSIRLLAEGLERGTVADVARRQEYFRLIGQETRRLGALVENVLDFSRIEQGRKTYDFEPTDLVALVRGTLRVFEPLATERGVRLGLSLAPPDLALELDADGRALQQALLNLLDNALKHSPAGTEIKVSLQSLPDSAPASPHSTPPTPNFIRLSVTDVGPGIPAADHARIFEPFYRRGSELRRDTQGVGIGLGIVKHIVEAHGGRVELGSEPGRGATFTLVLPGPTPCAS